MKHLKLYEEFNNQPINEGLESLKSKLKMGVLTLSMALSLLSCANDNKEREEMLNYLKTNDTAIYKKIVKEDSIRNVEVDQALDAASKATALPVLLSP